MPPLLEINQLAINLKGDSEVKELIKGLDLKVESSKIVALVGSSGSGKTTVGLSILRLLSAPMSMASGKIIFNNEDIMSFSKSRMQQLRGKNICMIFQEPLSAFNPVFTIGSQIEEVLRFHLKLRRRQRKQKILDLLDIVGISDPRRVARCYPHQLSGGMRQRAMIAQAIATDPQLIIADEPTSNLDVTLQALIIDLFRKIKEEHKISLLLITHDLGVVRELADEVSVLFDGRIVESGKARDVLADPHHPFTCELVNAVAV